jgi:hypothetical protein
MLPFASETQLEFSLNNKKRFKSGLHREYCGISSSLHQKLTILNAFEMSLQHYVSWLPTITHNAILQYYVLDVSL